MPEHDPIHISAICGSLREVSYTRFSLKVALQGASQMGATTHLIDLRHYDLIFCESGEPETPGVEQMRVDTAKSHGIILGTPVYHGGISGVLKNALDLMGKSEIEGRVLGLVGVAGGSTGAVLPLASLRNVGRALHAWVVPQEVSIPKVKNAFTPAGECIDANVETRLLELGRQVARFAYMHHSRQTQEFVRLWETGTENPALQD